MFARLPIIALAFRAAACTSEAAGTPPPTARSTAMAAAPSNGTVPAGRWRAVLIAGDNNSPAFDNGVQSLREKLVAHGVTSQGGVVSFQIQFKIFIQTVVTQETNNSFSIKIVLVL